MKNNKLNDLLKFGISKKSLLSLKESDINVLHKNLISEKKKESKEEVTKTVTQAIYDPNNVDDQKKLAQQGYRVDPATKKVTIIKQGKEKELGEGKKKKKEVNPWAVCHAQLGPKKTAKFERCVKGVKKSIEEGKDPFEVILETKILSMVEKHIKPSMKKGELFDLIGKKKMNYPIGKISNIGGVSEDTETAPAKPKTKPGTKTPPKTRPAHPGKNPNPNVNPDPKAKKETKENTETAPAKPKTKPGTKTPPKTRPSHPGKNPNPNVNPDPKAKNPEKVKKDMIGAIMNIIKK